MFSIPLEPLPKLTSAYDIERQTVWSCADEQNILVCVLEGSCAFSVLNEDLTLSAGQVLLLPARREYRRRPIDNKPCRFVYLHFSASISVCPESETLQQALTAETSETTLYLNRLTDFSARFEELRTLLQRILTTYAHHEPLIASLCLTELLAMMQSQALSAYRISPEPRMAGFPEPLRAAVEHIRRHFQEKLTLPLLADTAGLSQQHLNRLFQKYLSQSAMEYVNHVRISHAEELLRSSNLTMEEISYKLGFSSPAYFCRVFKKVKGLPPGDERNRIRNFKG